MRGDDTFDTAPSAATVVDATLMSTLDTLDGAVNYLEWIIGLAEPYLPSRVLEVGAGHGTYTAELATRGGSVTALEPSSGNCEILTSRFANDARVTVLQGVLADLPAEATFEAAVMINVLEHIDDDAGALSEIVNRLEPGGRLVIWVPAFQLLYSKFDADLGHHRRYRLAPLVHLVERSGFEVERSHYVNLPGWFSWLIITRLLGRRPTAGRLVSIFDRFVVPGVRALEHRVKPPFGQSIFLAARKPAG